MQIIISAATALSISNAATDAINEIFNETTKHGDMNDLINNDYVNFTSNVINDNVVVEINDELFFKYMNMYVRIAKIVAPFIKPIMSLLGSIKTDLKDIERFMNTKKL